ncbi:MAG: zinc ribbon domain-containing protein [Lachnospiraceae bacterium]|nr:zinc ribbon domain-containing protein [Lachnospiraceae bacterium]
MEKIKCIHCGCEIEEGASFCGSCGAKIVAEEAAAAEDVVVNEEAVATEEAAAADDMTVAATAAKPIKLSKEAPAELDDEKTVFAGVPESDDEKTVFAGTAKSIYETEEDEATISAVAGTLPEPAAPETSTTPAAPVVSTEPVANTTPAAPTAPAATVAATAAPAPNAAPTATAAAPAPSLTISPASNAAPGYSYTQVTGAAQAPNLIIHYSATQPSVAMVTRIVANGRKDVYYTGQTIEYTVFPGYHQLIMKIGSKNYSRNIVVPGDGTALHVYGAWDGRAQISIGQPYVVQCMYPIPPNIQAHVQSHTMRVDASMMTVRAMQQNGITQPAQQPMTQPAQQSMAQPQPTYASVPQPTVTISKEPDTREFSPVPIIALVLSLSFIFSIIGVIMGCITVSMKKIKLRGMGIAAIPVGIIFTLYGCLWFLTLLVEMFS